jgi:hypothetical protein
VNIRSAYTSAIAAMGIACSTSAFAGTVFVHAAYVPAALYVPARTLYYVPPQPHVVVPIVPAAPVVPYVAVVPPPAPARPLPYATVAVPIVAAPAFAVVPARSAFYAQPVATTSIVVTR